LGAYLECDGNWRALDLYIIILCPFIGHAVVLYDGMDTRARESLLPYLGLDLWGQESKLRKDHDQVLCLRHGEMDVKEDKYKER
jgi:hypothetical protein